jgi:hypothetical protein
MRLYSKALLLSVMIGCSRDFCLFCLMGFWAFYFTLLYFILGFRCIMINSDFVLIVFLLGVIGLS